MQHLEDLLPALASCHGLSTWEESFVESLLREQHRALSTKQCATLTKVALQHAAFLAANYGAGAEVIRSLKPQQEPYQSKNVPREVRLVAGNVLAFRFKRSKDITHDIHRLSARPTGEDPIVSFEASLQVWMVRCTPDNLLRIQQLISTHRFAYDDDVLVYLTGAAEAMDETVHLSVAHDETSHTAVVCVPRSSTIAHFVQSVLGGAWL